MRKRVIVSVATAAMFIAILMISSMASRVPMALLYAGLGGAESGEVVSAIEQRGIKYEVRGDSIFVEAPRRDELRMTLAAEGLPNTGAVGYELLDSLSGFGTTSQMFDAAYWRAKEGELARTLAASPTIRAARVHIAHPTNQPFRKDLHPTASVTLTSGPGGVSTAQAKAVRYMVASAVTGMTPEDVSVIDAARGLISSGDDDAAQTGGEERAAELKKNVERLLEARVGPGNAVVEVSVETMSEREAITEHRFDPETRVAISTDTVSSSKKSDATRPASVSVASNLPEGDGADGGKSQSQSSETRERTNYEVSETRRELLRTPGAVKRISVAVLVDGVVTTNSDGTTSWAARPDAELTALHDLVASAVGFDKARGDVITLRSMQFETVPALGTEASAGLLGNVYLDLTRIMQIALLALVALVLGLFVARPILMQKAAPQMAELPAPDEDISVRPALTGAIDEGEVSPGEMQVVPDLEFADLQMPMAMADSFDMDDQDPVARLKRMIEARQAETVEILRSWMEDREEKA